MRYRAIVAVVAAATVTVAATASAGAAEGGDADAAKRKPRVTQVSVDTKSTFKLSTFPATGSTTPGVSNVIGMTFDGVVKFKKVHLGVQTGAKLTKGIEKKARKTCVKLFAGGSVDGLIPTVQVYTHSGELPSAQFISQDLSLATSQFADTDISGAGTKTVRWNERAVRAASFEQFGRTWYGITPGYDIVARGGWWDPIREFMRDHSDTFKAKQRGKRGKRTVNCSRFEASTKWSG